MDLTPLIIVYLGVKLTAKRILSVGSGDVGLLTELMRRMLTNGEGMHTIIREALTWSATWRNVSFFHTCIASTSRKLLLKKANLIQMFVFHTPQVNVGEIFIYSHAVFYLWRMSTYCIVMEAKRGKQKNQHKNINEKAKHTHMYTHAHTITNTQHRSGGKSGNFKTKLIKSFFGNLMICITKSITR